MRSPNTLSPRPARCATPRAALFVVLFTIAGCADAPWSEAASGVVDGDPDREEAAEDSVSADGDALGEGPFLLAYSGTTIGVDLRSGVTATFDGPDLTGYEVSEDEAPTVGDARVDAPWVDAEAQLAWGTWREGTLGGALYGTTTVLEEGQGFHYLLAPPGAMPDSGGATFTTVIAETTPTLDDGAPVDARVAEVAVGLLFDEDRKVGLRLVLELDGETVTAETNGGAELPLHSSQRLEENGLWMFDTELIAGEPCADDDCTLRVRGIVSPTLSHVAFAYWFEGPSLPGIRGVVVVGE